jgi:hypothetical protein
VQTSLLGAKEMISQASGNIIQRLNFNLSRDHEGAAVNELLEKVDVSDKEPFNTDERDRKVLGRQKALSDLSEEKKNGKVPLPGLDYFFRKSVTIDEGSELIPGKVYTKLLLETDAHPFLERAWHLRHRLNEDSPLLTLEVRHMVLENKGFWPKELNNHSMVRKHLNFSSIIGTCGNRETRGYCRLV